MNNKYIRYRKINNQAKYRLFCFPFAGCSASYYLKWIESLHPGIDLFAIQLPGRENRFTENHILDMTTVNDELYKSVIPYLDRPFIFFGHSMGSVMVYELARRIQTQLHKVPLFIIISAGRTPDSYKDFKASHLSDEDMLEFVKKLGGVPEEIISDTIMQQLFLKLIRSDIQLLESYTYIQDNTKLKCPVVVLYSTNDIIVKKEHIKWDDFTTRDVSYKEFEDNHFFINNHLHDIIDIIHTNCQLC
jgi:medium-chain acyl-[acyl-carrier-protein] hydrolase